MNPPSSRVRRRRVHQRALQLGGERVEAPERCGQPRPELGPATLERRRQIRQHREAPSEAGEVPRRPEPGGEPSEDPLDVRHLSEEPRPGLPPDGLGRQLLHRVLAGADGVEVEERREQPLGQPARAERGDRPVHHAEQRTGPRAVPQRPEHLEVGPGGLVEHQGGLEREAPERVDVPGLGALGVLEVAERRAGSRHRPGRPFHAEPLERRHAEVGAEERAGPRGVEVGRLALGDRQRAECLAHRRPDRRRCVRPEQHLAWLVRGHGLEHRLQRGALQRPEVPGGHVQQRGPVRTLARVHRDEPRRPRGVQHVLVQHGAGGDDANDLPADDARTGPRRLHLLADGDLVASLEQLRQIASRRVERDAAHRHPVCALAPGGQGDAEQLRGPDRVLEEELVEVPEAEEEERVPGARLGVEVLADHRRDRHVGRLLVPRHCPCCRRCAPVHARRLASGLVSPTTSGGIRW